jgi:hypothetical protein
MEFKKWFVKERAKALALVLLTRRDDLVVEESNGDGSLDFTVSIGARKDHGGRRFGIIVAAGMRPVTTEEANQLLRPVLAKARELRDVSHPICVFYFTAKDDHGYFTWAYEPVIAGKRQAALKYHSEPHCVKLGDPSLAAMVLAVNKWYDAFQTMLAS